MYRAGKGIYKSFENWGRTAIVCGSGNNAGDGFVVAKLLHENGGDATLFLLSEKFSESGRYYFDMCAEIGVKTEKCTEKTDFSGFDTVLDCIFGTGFHGEVRGLAAEIIDKINESGAYIVSADINSGLDGNSGIGKVDTVGKVVAEILAGVLHGLPDQRKGGKVHDGIKISFAADIKNQRSVRKVALNKRRAGIDRRTVSGDESIKNSYLIPHIQQIFGTGTSDITGSAGDKDLFHNSFSRLYQSNLPLVERTPEMRGS